MPEIIAKTGVKREVGYLYFLDKQGNVARTKMARQSTNGRIVDKKQEVLARPGVKREQGFLYFIDKNGDVARSKMKGRK